MKTQTYPLATIGVTCFNARDTIARAVSSAKLQTWPNLELIIVDDCSTDTSCSIVEELIADLPNARLVRHSVNLGPAGARNTILKHAHGEFVVFFDDDDESSADRISVQIGQLVDYERLSGERLVACCASGVRRYGNGYSLDLHAIGSRGAAPNGPEFADYLLFFHRRDDWHYGCAVPACALLARRSTFVAIGGFDERLRRVEDNDFAIRLALAGGHFTGVIRPLFTQYSTNAADKTPEKNFEAEQAVVRKHRTYLEAKGRYYYSLHWPKLRYLHFKRRYAQMALQYFAIFIRHPLLATRHLFKTGPQRLFHELRMRRRVA